MKYILVWCGGLILGFFSGKICLMNIKVVPVNIKLLNRQKEELEKKFRELEKFTNHYKGEADLIITLGKTLTNQQTGEIFFAEANFSVSGKNIICKTTGNSIKEVETKLKLNLKELIIKNKELRRSRFRRLARVLKNKLHL